jgi:hypothetical protein
VKGTPTITRIKVRLHEGKLALALGDLPAARVAAEAVLAETRQHLTAMTESARTGQSAGALDRWWRLRSDAETTLSRIADAEAGVTR